MIKTTYILSTISFNPDETNPKPTKLIFCKNNGLWVFCIDQNHSLITFHGYTTNKVTLCSKDSSLCPVNHSVAESTFTKNFNPEDYTDLEIIKETKAQKILSANKEQLARFCLNLAYDLEQKNGRTFHSSSRLTW